MTDNAEGFPFEGFAANDENSLAHVRTVAERLYLHNTNPNDRAMIRSKAENRRRSLIADGWNLSDYEEQEQLWRMWFYTAADIQGVFPLLCSSYDQSCLPFHSIEALQWSAMVLLLATDQTIPNPDSEVS